MQPGLDLLLLRRTLAYRGCSLDELANPHGSDHVLVRKLPRDAQKALAYIGKIEQWQARGGEGFGAATLIADAVVNVVGVLALLPAHQRVPFHGEQGRYGGDGDLHADAHAASGGGTG